MKKTKRIVMVLIAVFLIGIVTMGAKGCDSQDVITGMEVAQSTLDVLYVGTASPMIAAYCEGTTEADEYYEACQKFPQVDAATKEFLTTTFPSMVEIAKAIIPEGTPANNETVKLFLKAYDKLPPEQQALIRHELVSNR